MCAAFWKRGIGFLRSEKPADTEAKRNYQQELDEIIRRQGKTRPRLLLHSCCGPCSSSVLEYLTQYYRVTLLWYNPNIYPQEEFDRRLQAQLQLLERAGLREKVPVMQVPRNSEAWYEAVRGLEREPEGGKRCTECFRLRLREAARIAAEGGFDCFCSTLTLSRHKDPVRINALGERFAEEFGVAWLPSEFKKRGRELRSKQLCEQYGIYRQNYCGCEYSVRDQKE
ncbi:MAG: epoxyqueuosine reductase QueH [Oscillospiraceae bacterium]|nr:epoxyqueuosine reductase QueH [Oscillospiraceae bacterium]